MVEKDNAIGYHQTDKNASEMLAVRELFVGFRHRRHSPYCRVPLPLH